MLRAQKFTLNNCSGFELKIVLVGSLAQRAEKTLWLIEKPVGPSCNRGSKGQAIRRQGGGPEFFLKIGFEIVPFEAILNILEELLLTIVFNIPMGPGIEHGVDFLHFKKPLLYAACNSLDTNSSFLSIFSFFFIFPNAYFFPKHHSPPP